MAKVVGNALPVGGLYNATPPTGQNEHPIPLYVDDEGNLKVSGIASGGSSVHENNAIPPMIPHGGTDDIQGDINDTTIVNPKPLSITIELMAAIPDRPSPRGY